MSFYFYFTRMEGNGLGGGGHPDPKVPQYVAGFLLKKMLKATVLTDN